MKTYLATAFGAVLLAGCSYQAAAQSDFTNAETKSYDVDEFTALDVATGIEVIFSTGGEQSVVAENVNGAWDKLEVKVKGDTLHLKRKKLSGFGYNRNKEKYRVTVSARTLSSLETSSGSSVTGSGLSGESVYVDTASGSYVSVTDISAEKLTADSSSGSTVKLAGTCSSIFADTSSGSSLRAKELICESADLEASSGSSLSATATNKVNADASSGSSINVAGNPQIRSVDKSSGASVNIRG